MGSVGLRLGHRRRHSQGPVPGPLQTDRRARAEAAETIRGALRDARRGPGEPAPAVSLRVALLLRRDGAALPAAARAVHRARAAAAGGEVRPRRPPVPLGGEIVGRVPREHRGRERADARILLAPRVSRQRRRARFRNRAGRRGGARRGAPALGQGLAARVRARHARGAGERRGLRDPARVDRPRVWVRAAGQRSRPAQKRVPPSHVRGERRFERHRRPDSPRRRRGARHELRTNARAALPQAAPAPSASAVPPPRAAVRARTHRARGRRRAQIDFGRRDLARGFRLGGLRGEVCRDESLGHDALPIPHRGRPRGRRRRRAPPRVRRERARVLAGVRRLRRRVRFAKGAGVALRRRRGESSVSEELRDARRRARARVLRALGPRRARGGHRGRPRAADRHRAQGPGDVPGDGGARRRRGAAAVGEATLRRRKNRARRFFFGGRGGRVGVRAGGERLARYHAVRVGGFPSPRGLGPGALEVGKREGAVFRQGGWARGTTEAHPLRTRRRRHVRRRLRRAGPRRVRRRGRRCFAARAPRGEVPASGAPRDGWRRFRREKRVRRL